MLLDFYEQYFQFLYEASKPLYPQVWSIPNTIVFENRSLRLRKFSPEGKSDRAPVLLLSPNAGHHLNICEPLVRRTLKVGRRDVYVVDWVVPTSSSPNRVDGIADLVSGVADSMQIAGGKAHLFTLCQGGWLGAIYAALYPDTVLSYTNAAGPIDFAAGDSKINEWLKVLPPSFFQGLVALGDGVHRGELQLAGFRALNPYDRYIGDFGELWEAVQKHDDRAIERWRRFHSWYDQPQNVSGTWYLEAVELLFRHNLLIKDRLEVLGRQVRLSEIRCPVWLLGGDRDDITPPEQVFNMADYISSKKIVKQLMCNCGHIGVFVRGPSLDWWEENIITRLSDALEPEIAVARSADKECALAGPAPCDCDGNPLDS